MVANFQLGTLKISCLSNKKESIENAKKWWEFHQKVFSSWFTLYTNNEWKSLLMNTLSMFDVLRLFKSDLSLFIVDSPLPLLNHFDVRFVVGFRCFSSPIISPNLAFLKKKQISLTIFLNLWKLIAVLHISTRF